MARQSWLQGFAAAGLAVALAASWSTGCAASGSFLLGAPLFNTRAPGGGGGGGGAPPSSGGGGGSAAIVTDACDEDLTLSQKVVNVSLRNLAENDFIHYFLVMIALVQTDTLAGDVCEADIPFYLEFGYQLIPEGGETVFGSYCIRGPALIYFHEQGRFRSSGGANADLASAIAPAQGPNASFDSFFTSSGASVPIPSLIALHNPGTGAGAALQVSTGFGTCAPDLAGPGRIVVFDPCNQDAFYYVRSDDTRSGSASLGAGSSRRIPSEIQGTGCECLGLADPFFTLSDFLQAPTNPGCNAFYRGGRIEIAFVREDTTPPFPQAVVRFTDSSGSVAVPFDDRAGVP